MLGNLSVLYCNFMVNGIRLKFPTLLPSFFGYQRIIDDSAIYSVLFEWIRAVLLAEWSLIRSLAAENRPPIIVSLQAPETTAGAASSG